MELWRRKKSIRKQEIGEVSMLLEQERGEERLQRRKESVRKSEKRQC